MLEAQEPKYDVNSDGRLFNRETGNVIPDDEPVFILRARDVNAIEAISFYHELCKIEGHAKVVLDRIAQFTDFSINYSDRMREPGQHRSNQGG